MSSSRTIGKKAIVVDGASLSCMRERVDIGIFKWKELHRVLNEDIGKEAPFERARYITRKVRTDGSPPHSGRDHFNSVVSNAGFFIKEAEGQGKSPDDAAVIEYIESLPEHIEEIIIVTSDSHFIPCLNERKERGARIYWVTTKYPHPTRLGSHIGAELSKLFESNQFTFIELATYADRIRLTRLNDLKFNWSITNVTVSHRTDIYVDRRSLIEYFEKARDLFPGVRIEIQKA